MLSYYGGDQPGGTPGIFNEIEGYYWWMAGAAWNVLHKHVKPKTNSRQSCSIGG